MDVYHKLKKLDQSQLSNIYYKLNNKKITKDIAYLGSDSKKIFEKLNLLPKKYSVEIRSAYRNINLFIETLLTFE